MKIWFVGWLTIAGITISAHAQDQLVGTYKVGSSEAALSQTFYIYGGVCHAFGVVACNLSISRRPLPATVGGDTTASLNVWVFLDESIAKKDEKNRIVKYFTSNSKSYRPVQLYLEIMKTSEGWQRLDGTVISVPEQEIQKPEYDGLDIASILRSQGEYSFSRYDK